MSCEKWFHANISREELETSVRNSGINGSFALRKNESFSGTYSLAVLHDNIVHNYRILFCNGFYALETTSGLSQTKFRTMSDLVTYYNTAKDSLICNLTNAVGLPVSSSATATTPCDIPLRNTSLYICNIPPGYGLFSLQQLIEKYLDDPDGIRSIEFIKQGDTGDCTVAEIHFRLPQHATKLLQRQEIVLSYEDQPHILTITADFSSLDIKPSHESSGEEIQSWSEGNKKSMQTQKIALSSEDKTPSPKMTEILVNETESHELNKKDKQSEIIVSAFQNRSPPKPLPRRTSSATTLADGGVHRISPSPIRECVSETNLIASKETPYTWHDLLQEDEQLFRKDPYRTVLVQSSKELSGEMLKDCFVHNELVDPDAVETIYKITDGALIVFYFVEDAERFLEGTPYKVDGYTFRLFQKPVPSILNDRFLLQGSFPGVDHIESLLGCCDVDPGVEPEITEYDQPDTFLVKYDRSVDTKEIIRAIEEMPLENVQPKVLQVCQTDCVKVENLDISTGNDAIRMAFMNRNNGCTGKVTKVERVQQGMDFLVFVYFANFKDAEQVVQKALEDEVLISGLSIEVSLYYHCMSREHICRNNRPQDTPHTRRRTPDVSDRKQVKPFDYVPNVKDDVTKFVRHSSNLLEQLQQQLKPFAEAEFKEKLVENNTSHTVVIVKPELKTIPHDCKNNQIKFRRKCSSLLSNFLNNFVSSSASYDEDNLARLRKSNSWTEDSTFARVPIKDDVIVAVHIKFNTPHPGHVTVIGWKDEVPQLLDYIRQKCECCRESLSFDQSSFRAMQECKIFEDLQESFESTVKISHDSKIFTLTYEGNKTAVAEARSQTSDLKLKLKTRAVSELGSVSKFLQIALQNRATENSFDVREVLQAHFDLEKIKVSIQFVDDQVCWLYVKQAEQFRAEKALMKIIQQQSFQLEQGFDDVVSSTQWKRLCQNLCSSGNPQMFVDKKKSKIDVVGLRYNFEEVIRQINEHIDVNAIITSTIPERPVVVQYFELHLGVFGKEAVDKLKNVEIDWRTKDKRKGEVVIKGNAANVESALQWIQSAISRISIVTQEIRDPGMPEYFRSKKGQEHLKTIGLKYHCLVLVEPPDWFTNKPKGPFKPTSRVKAAPNITMQIRHTNITVRALQVDIIDSQCQTIVNATNENLELLPAGVSGSILNTGGQVIQNEMNNYKSANGKLKPGQVMSTTGGNLTFKAVIHALGPRWQSGSEFENKRDLKKCVKKSLAEASNLGLKSIAIPAISCGVFGGKPELCIPLIVEAAVDYAEENEDCSVTQIDFVEKSNANVVELFVSSIRRVVGLESETKPQTSSYKSAFHLENKQPSTSTAESCPTFSLVTGDISTFATQVIVTSSYPCNNKSFRLTATSMALAERAGPQFQSACLKAATKGTVGNIVATSGFQLNCQEVYHVILDDYVASVGEFALTNAVRECLLKANSSGYSSIAFPALGAGGFGYPASLVMKCFQTVVSNFQPSSLQNIKLVLYPSDQACLTAARDVFNSDGPQTAFPNSSQGQSHEEKWENLSVSVKNADVLSSKCDVIVNSAKDFELTGQVGQAMISRGGPSIATECSVSPIRKSAFYRVTNGGQLSCKYIVHVNTPQDPRRLAAVLLDVLKVADELQMNSISFPAVGTGKTGLNSNDVARSLRKAIDDFDQLSPTWIKAVEVCVFQQQMLGDFHRWLFGSQRKQAFFEGVLGFFKSVFSSPKPKTERTSITSILPAASTLKTKPVSILICSHLKENTRKVIQDIQNTVEDVSLVKVIDEKELKNLTHFEEHELLEICKKHKVLIAWTKNSGQSTLSLSGQRSNVLDAYLSCIRVIHDLRDALRCFEYVAWKYKDQRSDEMTDFPLRANKELEKAHERNPRGTKVVDIFAGGRIQQFRVDFSNMEETCLTNKKVTPVDRCMKKAETSLPSHWDKMDGKLFKLVPLRASSKEYQSTLKLFTATAQFNVLKLERIQNPTLYKQFQEQKRKVEKRLRPGRAVSRTLFHGTSGDVCDKIYKDGFDRSHAGKHATKYGKGVYFAVESSYSKWYTKPDTKGHQRMFLVEVITGEFCVGNSTMMAIPMQKNGDPYDSLVNDMSNPSQHVVFRDASAYPLYILTFK